MIRQSRPRLVRSLAATSAAALCLAGLIAAAGPSLGDTTSSGTFSGSKSIERDHLINGRDQVVEQHNFHLTVSDTLNLRNEDQVTVSWSGAHPTSAVVSDPHSSNGPSQEYPMVLLECRGTDSGAAPAGQQLSPKTCWTETSAERYSDDSNTAFPPWRLDKYETPSNRAQVVGEPNPVPAACGPAAANEARRYVHFIAGTGADYPYGQSDCAGAPPEASNSSDSITPTNETYAVTGTDGTGTSLFDVWTTEQNASLGCTQGVACSLVAVPVLGISCDADGAALPAANRPSAGSQHDTAASRCEANGGVPAGQIAGGNAHANDTVTGAYWWSQSNWRNRISVPLTFAAPSNICDIVNSTNPVDIYGSELMTEAVTQWSPHFCLDPTLFRVKHIQTGEPQAVNLLNTKNIEAAFDNLPPPNGYKTPTVNAPAALTGFGLAYQVDGANGKPYANLRLTPRLIAKLLTQSYSIGSYLSGDLPYLAANPENISADPEFEALNPGIPQADSQIASVLLYASNDSDLMSELTSYITADPEARAWLDGMPDPWGMTVNPAYKGISLPTSSWPALDTTIRSIGVTAANDPCDFFNPVPYLGQVAAPLIRYQLVTQHIQFATPNDQVNCSINQNSPQLSKLGPEPRQTPGHQFMFAFTTLADAARYSIPVASLETYASSTAPTKFSDGTGRSFAAPTSDAIAAAARTMTPDSTNNLFDLNYGTLRSSAHAGAYPGSMLIYTSVPTAGLPTTDANDYATFMRFTATAGQIVGDANGDLAAGYVPINAANGLTALSDYTNTAASAVQAQAGNVPLLIPVGSSSPVTTSTVVGHATAKPTSSTAVHTSAKPSAASTVNSPAATSPIAGAGAVAAAEGAAVPGADSPDAPLTPPVDAVPVGAVAPVATPSVVAASSSGVTPGSDSGAAGWLLPLLLAVALLSGAASVGVRRVAP